MAYTTINKSTDYQNTVLYSGTGSSNAITGVGFQPDFTWIKKRSGAAHHCLEDAVRGVTKMVQSSSPDAEVTRTGGLTVFGADGFTIGGADGDFNGNGATFASWNWKMGTTSGISGGTITPSSYSFNTTAGQSIIAYTGTGSNATVPHGLGVAPEFIMLKRLNSADNWNVGHINNHATTPWDYTMKLNNTSSPTNDASIWNDTAPTATVFSIGTSTETNNSSSTYIAYCFAPKKGYSKFGKYIGNGNADGTFIYTGFRPSFLIIKRTDSADNWTINDNKRLGYNDDNNELFANLTNTEDSNDVVDLLSNGFKLRHTAGRHNSSGGSYIYMAFGQPIISNSGIVATAR